MPSDHWISDDDYYCNLVNSGIPEARKGKWVTFGIKPHYPSTAYGYIQYDEIIKSNLRELFRLKPLLKSHMVNLQKGLLIAVISYGMQGCFFGK